MMRSLEIGAHLVLRGGDGGAEVLDLVVRVVEGRPHRIEL
jgi:hypothetical protein